MKKTDEMKLISVIIPVYNAEPYLSRAIDSVRNQTYTNLQIILIDDGSLDKSGEICDSYKEKDSRIEVIHQKNRGQAEARNAGLKIARGELLGFVDSDDYIESDMYEKLYQGLQSYPASIACCGRTDLYEKKSKPQVRFAFQGMKFYSKKEAIKALCLYDGMDFAVWDKLIDACLFQNLKFPERRAAEDIPVVYELYKRAKGVIHIGEAKYFYCHRKKSVSGGRFYLQKANDVLFAGDVYKDILSEYPELKKEAEALFFRILVYRWYEVRNERKYTDKYVKIEKKLKKAVRSLLIRCAFNPYIERTEYFKALNEMF